MPIVINLSLKRHYSPIPVGIHLLLEIPGVQISYSSSLVLPCSVPVGPSNSSSLKSLLIPLLVFPLISQYRTDRSFPPSRIVTELAIIQRGLQVTITKLGAACTCLPRIRLERHLSMPSQASVSPLPRHLIFHSHITMSCPTTAGMSEETWPRMPWQGIAFPRRSWHTLW